MLPPLMSYITYIFKAGLINKMLEMGKEVINRYLIFIIVTYQSQMLMSHFSRLSDRVSEYILVNHGSDLRVVQSSE